MYYLLCVNLVVSQFYDVDVNKEYAIRGNAAILKCQVPSFVADFVSVVSWHTDQEENFFPGAPDGNNSMIFQWSNSFTRPRWTTSTSSVEMPPFSSAPYRRLWPTLSALCPGSTATVIPMILLQTAMVILLSGMQLVAFHGCVRLNPFPQVCRNPDV